MLTQYTVRCCSVQLPQEWCGISLRPGYLVLIKMEHHNVTTQLNCETVSQHSPVFMMYMSLKYRVQWPTSGRKSAEPPYRMRQPSVAASVWAPRPINTSPATFTFCQTCSSTHTTATTNMQRNKTVHKSFYILWAQEAEVLLRKLLTDSVYVHENVNSSWNDQIVTVSVTVSCLRRDLLSAYTHTNYIEIHIVYIQWQDCNFLTVNSHTE